MKQKIFTVKGMHCSSCELILKERLEETEGINKAEVSHEVEVANVEFDESKISEDAIKKIIKKEGYVVQ